MMLPPMLMQTTFGIIVALCGTVATTIAAIASMRAARATEETVLHMRAEAHSAYRPYLITNLEFGDHDGFLVLVIKNIGKTAAHNVRLSEVLLEPKGKDSTEVAKGWQRGIPCIAPGQVIETIFGFCSELFLTDWTHPDLPITLYYQDEDGKEFASKYVLSLSAFKGRLLGVSTIL